MRAGAPTRGPPLVPRRSAAAAATSRAAAAQVSTKPPTTAIFCNDPKLFSNNYQRYLERGRSPKSVAGREAAGPSHRAEAT